jgi:CheY-like chemotaxis protein/curved DNA-binding protein CbpA
VHGAILCVDDDRNLCQIIAEALSGEGYTARTAFDGDQALRALAEAPPALVLLDVILPRRDGFAVLESIRAMEAPLCDTPVVLITGCSPTPAYRDRAKSLGALEMITKPIPLNDLLAVVARCASEQKLEASVTQVERHSAAPKRAPGLSGSLEQLPIPALLHHLHGLRATGVLHLADGKKRKWIQLRDGYPRAVRSNLINECLGNFLVRGGKISQAAFAESRRRTRPGRLQGEILVAMEILSEEEITASLRAQADEKLFEIFGWESGTYRFEKDVGLQRANSLGLERSPANLILRGVRDRFPLDKIDDFICSNADGFLAHAESPFYQFQEVDLDAHHQELLAGLDGSKRLAGFLQADEDLKRTLYALLAFGLLELHGGDVQTLRRQPRRAPSPPKRCEDDELISRLMVQVERVRGQTYFEILGIDDSASEDETRVAYEREAERLHPDRYSRSGEAVAHLAKEVFSHLRVAYQTLMDPRRRTEYLLNQRRDERDVARREESQRALQAEMQFQHGQQFLAERAYERCLVSFGEALELYPAAGEYHAHYGWALHMCHPDDPAIAAEAIDHIRRGIKLAAHRETSYLFLGRLCKATGRVAAAEKMFARAVQIQPGCVEALRELRLIDMRRHKSKGLIGRLLGR